MVDKNTLDMKVMGLKARVDKLIVLKLFKQRTRTFKVHGRQLICFPYFSLFLLCFVYFFCAYRGRLLFVVTFVDDCF